FFLLISALSKIGILAWGTAVINLFVVVLSLLFIFKHFRAVHQGFAITGILLFGTLYLLTNSFNSVAATYLFSSGLQASNIASFATISALLCFLKSKYWVCGIWLALAGLFHINFLLVNMVAFGLAFALLEAKTIYRSLRLKPSQMTRLTQLLAPSTVYFLFCLPLILDLSQSSKDEHVAQLATQAFFQFAVPHHYLPNSYLMDFLSVLGWQLVGISFLNLTRRCRQLSALFHGCFIVIWVATALTTLVFVEPVARMFFWRLAPFCMVLVCIAIYTGITEVIGKRCQVTKRQLFIATVGTIFGALFILRMQLYYYDFTDLRVIIFAAVLAGIIAVPLLQCLALPCTAGVNFKALSRCALGVTVLLVVGSYYATFNAEKYSLIFLTEQEKNRRQLYSFVNQHTALDTHILIPPELDAFRLFSERSVVVDFKALPLGQANLVEWYRRLGDISGVTLPQSFHEVRQGYRKLDAARLKELQRRYNISHVVLNTQQPHEFASWQRIFKNGDYVLLRAQDHAQSRVEQ
ncbi:MAG: hypothetical protein KTR17_04435, partial [Cellvibrionaceae bacterium]|nr:hypothetical protein [Cellvibrionaceae bacterium]